VINAVAAGVGLSSRKQTSTPPRPGSWHHEPGGAGKWRPVLRISRGRATIVCDRDKRAALDQIAVARNARSVESARPQKARSERPPAAGHTVGEGWSSRKVREASDDRGSPVEIGEDLRDAIRSLTDRNAH
jgi:hypothetical protein